jgi:hypothetical protein
VTTRAWGLLGVLIALLMMVARYAIALNAHDGAMKEAHHKLKVGQSLEVINHDTGRLLCTYTRSASKGVTWR